MADFKLTKLAELDLEDIYDQVFPHDAEAALRLLDAIEKRCLALAELPNSGRNRDDLFQDLQSVTEGNYVIFFKAIENGVLVLRILHCKRESDRFFKPGALPDEVS